MDIGRLSRPLLTVSQSTSLAQADLDQLAQTAFSATEALHETKPQVDSRQRVDVSSTWIAARGHAPLLDKETDLAEDAVSVHTLMVVCWRS